MINVCFRFNGNKFSYICNAQMYIHMHVCLNVCKFYVPAHLLITKHSDVAQKNVNKMQINLIKKFLKPEDG